jgi:uncharacterized protein (DUF736 family)
MLIGKFSHVVTKFSGHIKTFGFETDAVFQQATKHSDKSPDFRITDKQGFDIGAAWEEISEKDNRYLSVQLDAPTYTKRTNQGLFAVETHTLYEQELVAGAAVRVRSWVIDVDSKRLHVAHEMYRASDMRRAACIETLNLHVNLENRRVTPWPEAQHSAMDAAARAHHEAGLPEWVGRRVQMRK